MIEESYVLNELITHIILLFVFFIACEDTCVQRILGTIENITNDFVNTQIVVPRRLEPLWNLLKNINESYYSVEHMYNAHESSMQRLLSYGESAEDELRKKVKNLKIKV